MVGNIYISGQIGTFDDVKGVELIDVIGQVQSQPNASYYDVYIDSEGGLVDVGFDIYNYLKALKKPVNTIGSGIVASVATVIFMAGSKRTTRKNTSFMIHLPWGEAIGTADEVEQYAKDLRNAEKQLMDFYKKTLSLSDEAIRPLLRDETWLTAEQLSKLGFTTSQPVMAKAKAYIKTDDKMSKPKTADTGKKDALKALMNWAKGVVGIKNKIVFDAENREVDFYDLDDDATISVGDMANIGSEPAEGSVLMADGDTFVFEAGVLIEILKPEDTTEMDALKEENEALALENTELVEALEAVKVKYEEKEAELATVNNKLKAFMKAQSRYTPEEKKDRGADKGKGQPSKASSAVAGLVNTNNKK